SRRAGLKAPGSAPRAIARRSTTASPGPDRARSRSRRSGGVVSRVWSTNSCSTSRNRSVRLEPDRGLFMRRFFHRLLNAFRDERSDAEAAREIAAHLALLEDEYRRRGLSADEARLAARRALGSAALARDRHRDARAFAWIDDARRDLVHGLRGLRRTPGFTAIAVITLALGIGANTAIFSVISAVLLRPLPYRNAERLVQVFTPPPNIPGGASFPRSARSFRQ